MSSLNGSCPFSVEESPENLSMNPTSELSLFNARVERARASENSAPASENLTSRWLAKNGPGTRTMLVDHLTRKLPTSRRVSVVEDHVQTFLLRLVERDTLGPFLREGKRIQPSVLRVWAYQSACTEMRGWGVDASLRKSRGAKTNRDRLADAGKLPQVVIQSPEAVVERRYEVENGEVVTDTHDPSARSVEDNVISSELFGQALSLLQASPEETDARLRTLLSSLGRSPKDLSRTQIAAMRERLREVLRDESLLAD